MKMKMWVGNVVLCSAKQYTFTCSVISICGMLDLKTAVYRDIEITYVKF
jgi:hypothetical protein